MVKHYDFRAFVGENWFQLGGCVVTAVMLYTGLRREMDNLQDTQAAIIKTQSTQSDDIKDVKDDVAEIKSALKTYSAADHECEAIHAGL